MLRLTLVIAIGALFFSPDKNVRAQSSGPQIVFTATRGEGLPKLYVMNADGTNVKRIGALSGGYSGPHFTLDNRRIVFQYSPPDSSGSQICIMNADGSGQKTLMSSGSLAGVTPEGRIVYSTWADNVAHTYLIDLDGSNKTEFMLQAPSVDLAQDLVFGPGGMVAFTGMYEFAHQIFTMKVNGANLRRLTNAPENHIDPMWSPNGSLIAYANTGPSSVPNGHEQDGIYIMNADGSHARRIVAINFGKDLGPENSIVNMGPGRYIPYLNAPISFSPDGAMLTYSVDMARRTQIYVVNSDGSGLTALTTAGSGSMSPSFSH